MKRFFITFMAVLVTVGIVSAVYRLGELHSAKNTTATRFHADRMAKADKIIEQAIADDDFPGAVLCVVKRAADGKSAGDVTYLKAYGNRQVCSGLDPVTAAPIGDTIPMTTDAVFDLASVSKCVGTTLSFMRLVEDGQVRLDDDVSRYIDGFKPWQSEPQIVKVNGKKKEIVETESITIKDLLTHTSGLPAAIHVPTFLARYDKYGDSVKMNLRDSLITYLANDAERLSRPRTEFRYSCLNFITVQAIIEKVTGQRLDRFARQEIYAPLRLKNTWYNALDDAERPYAPDAPIVPSTIGDDGHIICGAVHDPTARIVNRGVSGNAGVFSTAEDLAVIASMLMNGGSVSFPKSGLRGLLGGRDEVRVLSRRAIDTFFTIPAGYEEFGRALGWDVESPYASGNGDLFTPHRTINHTGYTGTSLVVDLDEGVAVIFLTNRVHPYDDGAVGRLRAEVSNIVASALE